MKMNYIIYNYTSILTSVIRVVNIRMFHTCFLCSLVHRKIGLYFLNDYTLKLVLLYNHLSRAFEINYFHKDK